LTGEQQLRYQLGPAGYTGPDGKFVPLTGAALEGASAGLDTQTGQWLVRPKFKPGEEGIDRFNALSAKCYAKAAECPTGQMAITLDGKVISAPSINAASFGADQIQISGSFTEDSAKALATALKYGALPVKLDRLSSERVSATLGQDALTAGLVAGFVGLLLVSIYMIAFYRLLGVLAILKLAVEGALLWAIISFLGSTVGLALTLAGVTGIIVSIGVSLDSNVVYYEHLREDTRNGRTIRSAVDRSFHNAIGTILKADGVAPRCRVAVLARHRAGPGFAFYLGLSTVLDLISSYLYMRPIVFLATGSKLCQRHPAWFGLPASAGTEAPPPSASRPSRSRSGSAPPGDGGSGRRSRRGSATALAERPPPRPNPAPAPTTPTTPLTPPPGRAHERHHPPVPGRERLQLHEALALGVRLSAALFVISIISRHAASTWASTSRAVCPGRSRRPASPSSRPETCSRPSASARRRCRSWAPTCCVCRRRPSRRPRRPRSPTPSVASRGCPGPR
jgi:protein-export membrane protein SecD